jgi:response regulator of citrate/malate metabolism
MGRAKNIVLMINDSTSMSEKLIPILEEIESIQLLLRAGSHLDAIKMLEGINPDIVLLDTHLPEENGTELLKIIRDSYEEVIVLILANKMSEVNN